jgi:hypothetical protein
MQPLCAIIKSESEPYLSAYLQLDLAAEIYHLREPQKIPLVMSQDETRRLLAAASSLKVRVLLSLGYGCGLRAGDVLSGAASRRALPDICRAPATMCLEIAHATLIANSLLCNRPRRTFQWTDMTLSIVSQAAPCWDWLWRVPLLAPSCRSKILAFHML